MNMNMNKIAGAVFLAGLIGMTTGKVTEFLYDGGPAHPGHHEEARGYSIEVIADATAAGGAAAPATAGDLSALYATADAAAGGALFGKKCATCHTADKGGADKVGPHLWGVYNRGVGSVAGFNYSTAMKAKGGKWDAAALNSFLWSPQKTLKGTIMSFAGITKDQDRANLIAYLASQSDSPAKPK
jgi:cytochrome c